MIIILSKLIILWLSWRDQTLFLTFVAIMNSYRLSVVFSSGIYSGTFAESINKKCTTILQEER